MDNLVKASYFLFLALKTTPRQFCIDWYIVDLPLSLNFMQVERKEQLYFNLLFGIYDREIEVIPYLIHRYVSIRLPLITQIIAWNKVRKLKKSMKNYIELVKPIYVNVLKYDCSVWMSKLNGMSELGINPDERIISMQGNINNKYMAKRVKLCPQK